MTSPIEFLSWDSRFFGCRIAKVKSTTLTPKRAEAAVSACLKQRVRCLYFLASSEDSAAIACAEAHGFQLMDIRITLAKELNSSTPMRLERLPAAVTYRAARPADIRPLKHLAKNLFPHSRFAVDPGFPPNASATLFTEWIAKSVRGHFDDWVSVAEDHGRLAGFVSCRKTDRAAGTIGLIGVARPFRRRRIGQGLLRQGLNWFHSHDIRHISVATQGRAVSVQRFYQDEGFRTSRTDLWYHKWF